MKDKICCIFNYAPHYRGPIYRLMGHELDCHFYFGSEIDTKITEMDVNSLQGFKKKLKRTKITKWNFFWLRGSLKPILSNYNYYIISGGYKYLNHWVLLFISKLSGKKVFAWAHGIRGNETKNDKKLKLLFYRQCDKVLLYSERSKELMMNEGFKEDKLVCIYNSLDYNFQRQLLTKVRNHTIYKEHFGNDFPVIIYTGRIQKSKRLEQLVSALEKIKKKGINCNLVFVGNDLGDNKVRKMAENHGLMNSIWFYGPCYDEKILAELISCASLCVSPGPIGLTAIHVATYGIPIVTNDDLNNQMPEFEIIKNGINGNFFRFGDEDDMIEKMILWIKASPEKRKIAYDYSQRIISEKYNPNYQLKVLKEIQ